MLNNSLLAAITLYFSQQSGGLLRLLSGLGLFPLLRSYALLGTMNIGRGVKHAQIELSKASSRMRTYVLPRDLAASGRAFVSALSRAEGAAGSSAGVCARSVGATWRPLTAKTRPLGIEYAEGGSSGGCSLPSPLLGSAILHSAGASAALGSPLLFLLGLSTATLSSAARTPAAHTRKYPVDLTEKCAAA